MTNFSSTSGITRRTFAGTAAASGLLLGLSPYVRAATPKKGGTFRLGLTGGSTSASLDPATYGTSTTQIPMLNVCNTLCEIDPAGHVVPELAKSWEASPDAKVWTFKLREGIRFHNGKPFTAADVVANYNHHRGEKSKSGAKTVLEGITSIRTDGPHTVVFELANGNADFPYITTDYHLVIFPSEEGRIDWQSGVGTGGYELKSFEPGIQMALSRHPDYWKTGRAHFDAVEVININDATSRTNALTTGDVDAINDVDVNTAHLLKRRPGIEIDEVTGTQHYTMPMFCDRAPFDDVNVRLALKYAIDREALVDTVLSGYGRVGNDSPITPANRFFNADMPQRHYDPDRARHHLKQAGLDALSVDLHASDAAFTGAVDTAVLFKEHAQKAGVQINVVREPEDGYWSDVWLKVPFCTSYWNGRPTEDAMFSLAYAADAKWNESHWQNERFNKLLPIARAELDESKRQDMYNEMQELVKDDGGTVIPMYASYVFAHDDSIQHGPLASNRALDGWKAIERWWKA